MQSLQSILRPVAQRLGLGKDSSLFLLRNQWADIVGEAVALHTYPDMLRRGVLTLIVDTPQWMHHLSFFKEDILSKLGPFSVTGLRYRIGRLPETSRDDRGPSTTELTEDDKRFIEDTLRGVQDEELREKLRKLMTHGLSMRRP